MSMLSTTAPSALARLRVPPVGGREALLAARAARPVVAAAAPCAAHMRAPASEVPPRRGPALVVELPAAPLAPGPVPERKRRRGEEATTAVLAHAERLGLTGPLGDEPPPDGAHTGNGAAARLERQVLHDAALAYDTPRLATALVWVERFEREIGRTLFMPARTHTGKAWNRRSLDMLTRFITSSTPIGRTRQGRVSHDVAKSYSAAVYLLRCRQAGYDIAPVDESFLAGLLGKTTRRSEPPAGTRALSMGVRATVFSAAAAAGFDRSSGSGEMRWAAGLAAHNLLL
jgi:hypothetical protein